VNRKESLSSTAGESGFVVSTGSRRSTLRDLIRLIAVLIVNLASPRPERASDHFNGIDPAHLAADARRTQPAGTPMGGNGTVIASFAAENLALDIQRAIIEP
jgi:hypothetical protein